MIIKVGIQLSTMTYSVATMQSFTYIGSGIIFLWKKKKMHGNVCLQEIKYKNYINLKKIPTDTCFHSNLIKHDLEHVKSSASLQFIWTSNLGSGW